MDKFGRDERVTLTEARHNPDIVPKADGGRKYLFCSQQAKKAEMQQSTRLGKNGEKSMQSTSGSTIQPKREVCVESQGSCPYGGRGRKPARW